MTRDTFFRRRFGLLKFFHSLRDCVGETQAGKRNALYELGEAGNLERVQCKPPEQGRDARFLFRSIKPNGKRNRHLVAGGVADASKCEHRYAAARTGIKDEGGFHVHGGGPGSLGEVSLLRHGFRDGGLRRERADDAVLQGEPGKQIVAGEVPGNEDVADFQSRIQTASKTGADQKIRASNLQEPGDLRPAGILADTRVADRDLFLAESARDYGQGAAADEPDILQFRDEIPAFLRERKSHRDFPVGGGTLA